jgi:hypothetical protein
MPPKNGPGNKQTNRAGRVGIKNICSEACLNVAIKLFYSRQKSPFQVQQVHDPKDTVDPDKLGVRSFGSNVVESVTVFTFD